MNEISLWVVGDGLRQPMVAVGETLQSLADREGLTTHDMNVDNVDVPRNNWKSFVLDNVKEIWASQGAKAAA